MIPNPGAGATDLNELVFVSDLEVSFISMDEGLASLALISATAGTAEGDGVLAIRSVMHDLQAEGVIALFLPKAGEILARVAFAPIGISRFLITDIDANRSYGFASSGAGVAP